MAILGDLTDLGVPDLVFLIRTRAMTGELLLERSGDDARLTFDSGRLVQVTSALVSQRLGELLVHLGRLTTTQLTQALAEQQTSPAGRQLGAQLLDEGLIAANDLGEVLYCQAEEILNRVLTWHDGTFFFSPRPIDPSVVPLPEINIQSLVLNSIRLADEYTVIRHRIPTLDCGVTMRAGLETLSAAQFSLKERIVMASIQRGASSLRQVADLTRLTEFELLRLVDDLVRREILTLQIPELTGQPPSPASVAKIVRIAAELAAISPHPRSRYRSKPSGGSDPSALFPSGG